MLLFSHNTTHFSFCWVEKLHFHPLCLGFSIHLFISPFVPTLICHQTVRTCLRGRRLSIFSFIFHFSPFVLLSSVHPSVLLKAQPMMTGPSLSLKNTFSSSICFPPLVPLRPSAFFISPQSPAVLASASEPSPPQTWRPRSPAPQTGSELVPLYQRVFLPDR